MTPRWKAIQRRGLADDGRAGEETTGYKFRRYTRKRQEFGEICMLYLSRNQMLSCGVESSILFSLAPGGPAGLLVCWFLIQNLLCLGESEKS